MCALPKAILLRATALVNQDELASLVIKSDHCYEAVPILLETVKQCCKTKFNVSQSK